MALKIPIRCRCFELELDVTNSYFGYSAGHVTSQGFESNVYSTTDVWWNWLRAVQHCSNRKMASISQVIVLCPYHWNISQLAPLQLTKVDFYCEKGSVICFIIFSQIIKVASHLLSRIKSSDYNVVHFRYNVRTHYTQFFQALV